MFDIDKDCRNAVLACAKLGDGWSKGKTAISRLGKEVAVFYTGKEGDINQIFNFNVNTKHFWFSNCGWPSRTSKLRINDCFRALDIPLQTGLSKGRFHVKNTKTGAMWICGDGKITDIELKEKSLI